MKFDLVILKNLIKNDKYVRKVIAHLKEDYFDSLYERKLFNIISEYISKYNDLPTHEALVITIENSYGDNVYYENLIQILNEINQDTENSKLDWLVDETEKWCQDAAYYNAAVMATEIHDGKSKLKKSAIPQLFENALSVSFDTNIGHSYLDGAEDRYSFYTDVEDKVKFDIPILNDITDGGLSRKTLNMLLAPPHSAKTLSMCHFASGFMAQGYSVLYITLEIQEKEIGKRIDANLLNIPIGSLKRISKVDFNKKVDNIKSKITGQLIIKEFPPRSISALHIKSLLQELKLKRKFVPDVIIVDYLNLCVSSSYGGNKDANSYFVVQAICEELRALAIEFDVPVVTATQTNKEGFKTSDPDITHVSESFGGGPATSDLLLALIRTEESKALNQINVKQLKNRYRDLSYCTKFVVGVDTSYMRLYQVDDYHQSYEKPQEEIKIEQTKFRNKLKDNTSNRNKIIF